MLSQKKSWIFAFVTSNTQIFAAENFFTPLCLRISGDFPILNPFKKKYLNLENIHIRCISQRHGIVSSFAMAPKGKFLLQTFYKMDFYNKSINY